MEYVGPLFMAFFVWGVMWMWRVGRGGPRALNALAETVVLLALPVGPFVWLALRRRDEQRPSR